MLPLALGRSSAATDYYLNVTRGLDALERGATVAAVDAFIVAQRLAPEDFLAHAGLATAALHLGDNIAAVSEFRAALRLNPHASVAYNGLGIGYLLHNSANDAVVNFGNAVRQDLTYADAYVNLAYAHCLENKPRDAMEQCVNAQRAGAEGPFFFEVQAVAHFLLGSSDNAILALRRLMQRRQQADDSHGLTLTTPSARLIVVNDAPVLPDFSDILRRVQAAQRSPVQPAVLRSHSGSVNTGDGQRISVSDRTGGTEVVGVIRFIASGASAGSDRWQDDIEYVSFAVDGVTRAVTNAPPYAWDWDTSENRDGEHLITIRAYDKSKALIGERRVPVRVRNTYDPRSAVSVANYTAEQEAYAVARLKKYLKLRANPLRAQYLLAKSYESKGLAEFALHEYTLLFLEQNDYLDTRAKIHSLKQHLGKSYAPGRIPEINSVANTGKRVALTFDDGPRPPFTQQILDLLKKHDARGTFFVVGKMAEQYPDQVRAIVAAGHELASHSYTHRRMTELTDIEVEDEILRTEAVVRDIADRTTEYFRPPGGHYDRSVREALSRLGYKAVFWGPNITSFPDLPPKQIARALIDRVEPGCIILLHNGEDQTIPALPTLLAGLESLGYEMVTLTELLESGKPVPRKFAWE